MYCLLDHSCFGLCIRRFFTIRIVSQSVRRDKVQFFYHFDPKTTHAALKQNSWVQPLPKLEIVMAIPVSETMELSVSKARMCRLRLIWRWGSVLRFRGNASMDKSELTTSTGYLYMQKRQNSGSSYFIECVSLIQTVLSERFLSNIQITNEFALGILLHLTVEYSTFFLRSFYHLLTFLHYKL